MNFTVSTQFIKIISAAILSSALVFSTVAQANNEITIPKLNDAQVFAEFSDKFPAVANYFTAFTESEIIAFYQDKYGDIANQERKRGRLTLHFNHEEQNIRVVVSQQNRKRQVDVLVEKK